MGTKKRLIRVITALVLTAALAVPLLSPTAALADTGDITDSTLDALVFEAGKGDQPSMIYVSGDVYAIAYKGTDDDGWLATVKIDSSGNIPAAVEDTLEFDETKGDQPSMIYVYGDVYAIAYKSDSGELVTVDIDTDGDIGAVLYTHQYHATKGDHPSIIRVSDDVIAIAYKGTDDDGWLATYEIDTDPGPTFGDITAIGTLEFDETKGDQPSMIYVYAIAYKSDSGELATVGIETPTEGLLPVGGEVYPVDELDLLEPGTGSDEPAGGITTHTSLALWIGLALILAIGGGVLALRRRKAH